MSNFAVHISHSKRQDMNKNTKANMYSTFSGILFLSVRKSVCKTRKKPQQQQKSVECNAKCAEKKEKTHNKDWMEKKLQWMYTQYVCYKKYVCLGDINFEKISL